MIRDDVDGELLLLVEGLDEDDDELVLGEELTGDELLDVLGEELLGRTRRAGVRSPMAMRGAFSADFFLDAAFFFFGAAFFFPLGAAFFLACFFFFWAIASSLTRPIMLPPAGERKEFGEGKLERHSRSNDAARGPKRAVAGIMAA